ncbi:MAG: cyclophilin-like fold protein [Bacillota bacterium]|nr:cyclophilin-like fold protein [Bacillota bacterium]
MRIRITAGDVSALAELNESRTAAAIAAALPIDGRANTWGEEIYFPIPVKLGSENGRVEVAVGDLGYWPPGSAFCIFFGRTPASIGPEPRAASLVNVCGRLLSDPGLFRKVKDGTPIHLEPAE